MSHHPHAKHEGAAAPVSYAKDIKPLFSTKTDIPHMAQHGIHLDQYQSTSDNATDIYGRLTQPPHSQQLMPPDVYKRQSLMKCQMIRVISSPSSSTIGFLTLIVFRGGCSCMRDVYKRQVYQARSWATDMILLPCGRLRRTSSRVPPACASPTAARRS